MKRNHWIELSQRFYLQLLHLYPHAYREQYEMEMFCFFTGQCREAYLQRGSLGILSLWPRTLLDLGAKRRRRRGRDRERHAGHGPSVATLARDDGSRRDNRRSGGHPSALPRVHGRVAAARVPR